MIPCSIAMITLNAEKTLRRALESVCEFDDIVIYDGNSTDGTLEIARQFGARILSQSPGGPQNYRLSDFGEEKQKAVDAARNGWVFILDSDERMSGDLVREIRGLVAGPPVVGRVPRKLFLDGREVKHAFFYPDRYPRFFHKSTGAHFEPGKVLHEKIKFHPDACVITVEHPLYHTWPSYPECLEKDRNNIALALDAVRKKPFGLWHWFKWVVIHDALVLGKVIAKMIFLTLMHPGQDTLSWKWNWRVIRAELIQGYQTTRIIFKARLY